VLTDRARAPVFIEYLLDQNSALTPPAQGRSRATQQLSHQPAFSGRSSEHDRQAARAFLRGMLRVAVHATYRALRRCRRADAGDGPRIDRCMIHLCLQAPR
jgi:hypothetical protein